jgi:signal peptidase I
MARDESVKRRRRAGRSLETTLIIVLPLLLLFGLRFLAVQPFRAPSGSMQPTIEVGDYFVVTRWSYGYGRYSFAPFQHLLPAGRVFGHAPERGDIVVFRPPAEPDRDFVKRVVGLPGDRIQMIDGVLNINGEAVKIEPLGLTDLVEPDGFTSKIETWRESLPNGVSYQVFNRIEGGELDNTREFVVPEGAYFMMGDDRDNSQDSRTPFIGMVPFDNLIGKVAFKMGS